MSTGLAERPKSIAHMGRLATVTPREILERYFSDESTDSIAKDYGVTRQALSHFMLRNAEDDWKEAQVARAITRKEKAEDAITAATNVFDLARAREELKSAQWDLERVCRRIYGQQDSQAHVSAADLADLLMTISSRMLAERQVNSVPEPVDNPSLALHK